MYRSDFYGSFTAYNTDMHTFNSLGSTINFEIMKQNHQIVILAATREALVPTDTCASIYSRLSAHIVITFRVAQLEENVAYSHTNRVRISDKCILCFFFQF